MSKVKTDTDFEQLAHDTDIIARLTQFRDAAMRVKDTINLINNPEIYENLSNADKIKYDLVVSYSLNTLFWMYLRGEGMDPTKHQIRNENDRLKKAMVRAKQIADRNTLMPHVNKEAAQRFVRNSLWEPKDNRKRHKPNDDQNNKTSEK